MVGERRGARPVRLAHIWSSDMGIAGAMPRIRHFVDAGWQVFAICPDGPRLAGVRAQGVRWLPLSLSRSAIDARGAVAAAWQIARHCARHRFDLVHTHNIKAGMIGRVAARLAGVPGVVHTVHGLPFGVDSPVVRRYAHAALERAAARFADRVLVQSRDDLDALVRHGVGRGVLTLIGNGVALDRFDPEAVSGAAVRRELGLAAGDVLVLSAGRLVRGKGFLELAEATALARAADPRVHTVVVGPRDPVKPDALTARELATCERAGVRLLGERADMPELCAAADVIALASRHEGLPRFLLEGAAIGRPLLATACRGSREVVDAPRGGVLVEVGDAAATAAGLADAMLALARDPERRRRLGAHNRARARHLYDIRTVIARLEAVYRALLAERPGYI